MKIIINFDLLIPAFSLLIVFNIEIHISISIFIQNVWLPILLKNYDFSVKMLNSMNF
jgi:hypothetical protein